MDEITLTRENLHELSGSPGKSGFTRKQIELLGLTWPPQKGWLTGLIGQKLTSAKFAAVKAACRKKWIEPASPKEKGQKALLLGIGGHLKLDYPFTGAEPPEIRLMQTGLPAIQFIFVWHYFDGALNRPIYRLKEAHTQYPS